ncbi:MAG: hypothetical protein COA71_14455 [SAR86 cluster bacterium]|uniref:Holin of 3TMs, for gene-transfer release n=1 Tax=SAR86 cluster bacterium TaxID=2030880 RepID=A0A2A5C5Y0_9GAMM|nr:MAG: hypothetical protein COA71_14455 [SAR86 cluster bacterium]
MGFLTKLFTSTAAEPIKAIGNVLDDLFTSDEEELNLKIIKQRLEQKPALIQAEIMKVQAQHRSLFVAGCRPFLMWVCGFGFMFAFIINPVLQWLLPEIGAPELPLDVIMELTLAMLGLSGLRTLEKIKGLTR